MRHSELSQIELLASIDDLRQQVGSWVAQPTDWEPMRRCQSLLSRVLQRVENLRIRLEAPLVVATFGGTGTGKSSLVNALVGEECSRSGRQRPTTKKPILIAHSETELSVLGLPLDEVEVVQRDADLLRDVIILDCPDPDTNEEGTPGSNLDRLRTLLPYCDVLLYVSTQQKYRSARVSTELLSAASGCRMIFVQTHAELDEDIREDWRATLGAEFEVPEVFFVDSLRAMKEQQAGQRPSGEMGRLIEMLSTQLGTSSRVQIRRANVADLLQAGLARCQEILAAKMPGVKGLSAALVEQKEALSARMAGRLRDELLSGRSLWERRLLSDVTDRWGISPFSSVLSLYNGLGGIVASLTLFRARTTVQMAVLGTIHGARWLGEKRKEQEAESSLSRVSSFGLDDAVLRESEIVIEGHVRQAGFSAELLSRGTIDDLRRQAAAVEDQFVGNAGQHVEEIIHSLANQNSKPWVRGLYELLFMAYLGFVLLRVGKNFFVDSLWYDTELLSGDFYLAAGLFLILWTGLLVISFTRRLRSGLNSHVERLVGRMVESKLATGLFPMLEDATRDAESADTQIVHLAEQTAELRNELAGSSHLGVQRSQAVPQNV